MDPHYSVVSHELIAVHSVASSLQALIASLKDIPLMINILIEVFSWLKISLIADVVL